MIVSLAVGLVFVFLIIAGMMYPKYDVRTHWISNLGESKAKSRPFFLAGTLLIVIIGANLVRDLWMMSGGLNGVRIGAIFLAVGIALLLPTMYMPMDKNLELHTKLGGFMFLSINLGMIMMLITPLIFSSPTLLLITALIIMTVNLLAIAATQLVKKLGTMPVNLVGLREKESFLVRNATVWEWMTLILLLLWVVLVQAAV